MYLVHADPVLLGWQQHDKLGSSCSRRADYCDSMEELSLALRSVALSARRGLAGKRDRSHPRVSK